MSPDTEATALGCTTDPLPRSRRRAPDSNAVSLVIERDRVRFPSLGTEDSDVSPTQSGTPLRWDGLELTTSPSEFFPATRRSLAHFYCDHSGRAHAHDDAPHAREKHHLPETPRAPRNSPSFQVTRVENPADVSTHCATVRPRSSFSTTGRSTISRSTEPTTLTEVATLMTERTPQPNCGLIKPRFGVNADP